MRRFYFAVLASAFALSLGFAFAPTAQAGSMNKMTTTRCRDAKGKFVKCTTMKPKPKVTRCRDAKGKFVKCKM